MKKMRRFFWIGCVCTTAFTACLDNDETEFEKRQKEEEKILTDFFTENDIEATRDQYGVYYEELDESSGTEVKEDEIVSVYYKMYTLAGDLIDSVVASTDEPVRFVHSPFSSYNIIPKGIDLGVAHMSMGDTYRFYIPSYYAFGSYSRTNVIPARAILKVELTVADVQTEAELLEIEKDSIEAYLAVHNIEDYKQYSSGLYYKQTKEGGGNNAAKGQTVKVHYVGKYLDGTEFDKTDADEPLEITNFGNGNLIKGFEDGLAEMKEGEEGILIIPSQLAYGAGVQIVPEKIRKDYLKENELRDIPPLKPLIFELKVVDI
jgi:FKBP-type peptidyl-prolyl cis-trans isomerase